MSQMTIPENRSKIEADFWRFHKEHPEVYDELRKLALDLYLSGQRKFGIGMIYEVLRWKRMSDVQWRGTFKLNNNYRAYYARLLMAMNPELQGVFNTRELGVPSHVV